MSGDVEMCEGGRKEEEGTCVLRYRCIIIFTVFSYLILTTFFEGYEQFAPKTNFGSPESATR